MPTTPFDMMREEHLTLLTEIGDLQLKARELTSYEPDKLSGDAHLLRDEIEIFARHLKFHFRREEECLYPQAQHLISESAEGADVFGRFFAEEAEDDMSAHAALSRRTAEMHEAAERIGTAPGGPDHLARLTALANHTKSLLERHAAKEDTLIFPMIEKSLSDDDIDAITSRLNEIGSARDLLTSEEEGPRLKQLGE